MKHGDKIQIPVITYHVTFYKPSKEGNLRSYAFRDVDELRTVIDNHLRTGFTIFNFYVSTTQLKTDYVID